MAISTSPLCRMFLARIFAIPLFVNVHHGGSSSLLSSESSAEEPDDEYRILGRRRFWPTAAGKGVVDVIGSGLRGGEGGVGGSYMAEAEGQSTLRVKTHEGQSGLVSRSSRASHPAEDRSSSGYWSQVDFCPSLRLTPSCDTGQGSSVGSWAKSQTPPRCRHRSPCS